MARKNKTIEKLKKEALKELKKSQKAEAKAVAETAPSNVALATNMLREIKATGVSVAAMSLASGVNTLTLTAILKARSSRISQKVFDRIKTYHENMAFPISIPASTREPAAAPKRLGRPPKVKTVDSSPAPKRRGRPPKAQQQDEISFVPKKRGRPAKAHPAETATALKRRGRPPKSDLSQLEMPVEAVVAKKGRKPAPVKNKAGQEIDVIAMIDEKITRLQAAKVEYLKARQVAMEFLD
jgi:hypothetical protein